MGGNSNFYPLLPPPNSWFWNLGEGRVGVTNVVIAALRSKKGASYRLLSLAGTEKFNTHDSVALVLEYEDVIQRHRVEPRSLSS